MALDSFTAFYGTRKFNTEFTRALQLKGTAQNNNFMYYLTFGSRGSIVGYCATSREVAGTIPNVMRFFS
jgi:hypothetical protein